MGNDLSDIIGVLIDFALVARKKKEFNKSIQLLEHAYDIAKIGGYEELADKIQSILLLSHKKKNNSEVNSLLTYKLLNNNKIML